MMQGVYFESHGKLKDVLKFGTIPKPVENELAPGEMIIQVNAGALNPADYKSAEGEQKLLLNFEWPRQYGFDFSGTVVAINAHDTFQVCTISQKAGNMLLIYQAETKKNPVVDR